MDRGNLDEILLPKVLQAPEETVHVNLPDLEYQTKLILCKLSSLSTTN